MRLIVGEGDAFEGDVEVAERNGMKGVEQEARRHCNQDYVDIFDEINQHCYDQPQL
jgi:hypothetical protein